MPLSRRLFLRRVAYAGAAAVLAPVRGWGSREITGASGGTPEIVYSASPSVPLICLTIDDWFDRSMVELALDVAARERVSLTFFPIGRLVGPNADLIRRAARAGHEIENHTWDHQRLDLGHSPIARIPGEIEQHYAAVRKILGPTYRQHFLRPPGGFGILGEPNPYLLRAAQGAGLRIAMWSVDSRGWRAGRRADPAAVDLALANVLPRLTPGAIVLQHAIPADVLALETEIRVAKSRGLSMVTMAEAVLGQEPPSPGTPRGPGLRPA